ncbi:MAG: hypothetical protein AMJ95_03860 [Omnitrophica WOR_2 bacterium SM23_72]|nr:MAG: hypothetical protein AMJ95_03860 [Omnitrophica WOR_2 bacterium SM23_72]
MMLRNRQLLLGVLLLGLILVAGCETTRGFATGVDSTTEGVTEGVIKDAEGIWPAIVRLDNWIRKNLW